METGTLLAQRYRIDAKLGEGGMGVVYKAHDTLLDRPVAIKTLTPHLLGDEGLKRLLREAQSSARLTHPNIVAIYDVIDDRDARLIVMEYVAGHTLRDRLPLPWAEAVEIATQVCAALDYAHTQGVVHRDIKPENIIITSDGTAKVMDFGLARSEGRSRLTQTGMIVGTVAYMAPEQALSGQVDGRSDLYSLGAVLYEAITGKPPFQADDPISVISMHVNVPPVSPRFYTPEIPTVLESVLVRLLAKDPTERYASAEEVARVLRSALAPVESGDDAALAVEARPAMPSLFEMMTHGRLIDREEELASLKNSLESMLSARGQVLLVAGEPGIGKTRLAEELLVYARLRGCLAVVGRCYEQEVSIPYLPLSEALRAAVRSIPGDRLTALAGVHGAELVKLVPELAQRIPGLTPSPPLEPEQERLRLFESVTAFLGGLGRAQPLVLMLDDLHWADAATLHLLRHLARHIRAERLLILGTYRDVEVDRTHPLSSVLSEMNRERLYLRVLVRGLTPPHVASMIQSIFQARQPVSDEMRDLIYRETEGNPFFVEEVLKHLVEVGAMYIEEGRWGRKPVQEIDVPQSIREVIGRRLERVSEVCLRVLSLGAVIGRRFRFEVLQAVGELREEELLDAVEEATRALLIREEREAGAVEYDFAHALIREVLYERLSLRRRMTLHQKVGEALEQQYAGRLESVVEDLAHHFTLAPQGEGLEKAIRYSLEAASKSMSLFAHEDAVRYYRNAAELLAEAGDERRLAETSLAMGEPFSYLDDTPSAVAAYERALAYYERRGAPADVARAHRLIGHALQRHWDFSQAIPHLERALQGLDPEEQAADVIRTHLGLARAKFFVGKNEEAEEHAAQALALASAHGALSMQADAHTTLGLITSYRMDVDGAMAHLTKAVALAREATDAEAHFTLGRSLNNLALLHEQRGEDAEGLRLLLEALDVAKRARDVQHISFVNWRLGFYHYLRGDWRAAKRYALENLQMPLSSINRQETEYLLRVLEGDLETAASLARGLVEHHRRAGELQGVFGWNGALAFLSLELGRVQEAHEAAAEAAGMAESLRFFNPFVAEALARGGDYERCEAFCTRGEALSRAAGNPRGMAPVLRGRAILALERGDPDGAVRLLDESLPLAKQIGPLPHAYTLHALAEALTRRGNRDDIERAKGVLQECLTLLEQMGFTRKAEQVRAQLAALN